MRQIFLLILIIMSMFGIITIASSATNDYNHYGKKQLYKGRPLQDQIQQKNTVYVIKNSININGDTLLLPEGSILLFKKRGRLYNGTLMGNRTKIIAPKRKVLDNVSIARNGSWENAYGYPEWFGASNKKSFDSKMAIQKAIDVSDTCVLSQNYFTAYDTKTFRGDNIDFCAIEIENKAIKGLNGNRLYIDSKYSNTEKTTVFCIGSNVSFDGVNIEYYNEDHSGWTGTQAGVYRIRGGNVSICNTTLRGAMAAWINLIGAPEREGYVFKNNFIHDCDCGIIIQGNQHVDGELYSIKMQIVDNVIEKEKERHSEIVVFWGSCKDGGCVYYTDVTIKNNHFSGGFIGGCITNHPQRCGLRNITITDNTFYDCGACSFYNAKGITYLRNFVTGSTFIERQSKGLYGTYPDLAFTNCSECIVDDNSCFGLFFKDCDGLNIGKLKQTLMLTSTDSLLLKNNDYITNFIGVAAFNSNVSIDELIINPFSCDVANSDICRYLIHRGNKSIVSVGTVISSIPIQVSQNKIIIDKLFFLPGKYKLSYIETNGQ